MKIKYLQGLYSLVADLEKKNPGLVLYRARERLAKNLIKAIEDDCKADGLHSIMNLDYKWEKKEYNEIDLVIFEPKYDDSICITLEFEKHRKDFHVRDSVRDSMRKEYICGLINKLPDLAVPEKKRKDF